MEDPDFAWNEEKAKANLKKHGVSFVEAATIFNDPRLATISDPDHSEDEDRYVSIGMSAVMRLLSVVHVFRKEKHRLISARKATKTEKERYEDH